MVIIIPKQTGDDFAAGINQYLFIVSKIRKLSNPIEELTFDFSKSSHLKPSLLLPLLLLIKEQKKQRPVFIKLGEHNYMFNSYLELILFDDGLIPENKNDYESFLQSYTVKTYIPIINFPASNILSATKIRDTFLSVVHSVLCQQINLKGGFQIAVMYLISEAINNIVDHSQEERGFIFAQYFPTKAFIDICIADSGISISGSFKKNGETFNDKTAVYLAVNGKSSKDTDGGRGYGIPTSKRMLANGLKGKYFIISGNSFMYKNSEKEDVVEIPEVIRHQGTLVVLRIPYSGNIDFTPSDYYE